ncbi:hypothetical protein ACHAXN_005152 [Cyclotella atomus]
MNQAKELLHKLLHINFPKQQSSIPSPSTQTDETSSLLTHRYFLLILLIILFWPLLLTVIAASVSASAWLFWLVVGAVFGLLQLLYVLYNFLMITVDLGGLTLLKSFALIRSYVRYYGYKMYNAAAGGRSSGSGGSSSSSKEGSGMRGESRFRRRKEWREEVETASSYREYCQIELYEPKNSMVAHQSEGDDQNALRSSFKLNPIASRGAAEATLAAEHVIPAASPRSGFGLRKRYTKSQSETNEQNESMQQPPSSPKRSSDIATSSQSSPSSPMRKIHSCLDFQHSPSSNSIHSSDRPSPVKRVSSTASLPNNNNDSSQQDYPQWQRVVREDLGMAGDMLLATLARLLEARLQATSPNTHIESNFFTGAATNYSNAFDNEPSLQESKPFTNPSLERNEDYSSSLKFLLSGIIKRNHLSVDDALINDCRSVAERGQHSLRKETRDAIDCYGDEVERCMDWVANGPVYLGGGEAAKDDVDGISREQVMQRQLDELDKRYTLVKRMKQNMGHTALMLSGGGAIAMYHLGTIKALVESNLYEQIHVISGTSGGSIAAAMCAIKSPDELLRDICVNTVSTDYLLTGEMKKSNIRWFPELLDMGKYWLKNGVLADSSEFKRCCEFYYKDITFEEAFEMTKKHVCITVTASRASAGSGVQRLLLNHISTPNVTLASAVAASCSLPGFMKPTKLMIKDSRGKQVPFEVDGVEWIDGSVQADLPFKRISTLFNVSNFVVAQVNFHVVPFLNKAHHPNINTLYWKLFQICMWDVRSRVLNLSSLGLFPKLFGQDVTKVFKQKYYGNLTLVPRFTTMQIFGLKAFQNPTVEDMDIYLQDGQIAAWPYLRVIKEMLRLEVSIDSCLGKLKQRINSIEAKTGNQHAADDADSLSLSSATAYRAGRLPGLGREAELLKEKNDALTQEVAQLRRQVARYQRALGISNTAPSATESRGTMVGRFVSVGRVEEEEDDQLRLEEKKSS